MKYIRAEEKITSSTFYDKMAPQILEILNNMDTGEDFVIDLSKTESVDAMAVPLLLNTARWIIGQKKTIPQIYIPNLDEKDNLKNYLEKVGFFNVCDFYDYYEINTERMSVKMNQANFATYIFTENAKCDSQDKDYIQKERERIEESVFRKLINSNTNNSYTLFWDYWKEFNVSQGGGNIIETVVRAICANTGIHTKENAILTLQRNVKLKRVCISVADCGQGLYDTLRRKKSFQPASISLDKFNNLEGDEADLYAIAEAVAYRFQQKVYGLYHVLTKLLDLEKKQDKDNIWKMRIHTNNKRIVFTGNNCRELKTATTKEQFAQKIIILSKSEYVARKTCNYPGVHIEIEIPYDKGKI